MRPAAFVILTPGFAANEQDSTCLPAHQSFVKNLKEQHPSIEIIIIAFQYPHFTGEYSFHQCRVIAMGGKGRSKLFRLLTWFRVMKHLNLISKNYLIKGFLSLWYGECALVGKKAAKKYSVMHRCWILGQDAKKENNYVQRVRLPGNDLIALSDLTQRTFYYNHQILPASVIPLGIECIDLPKLQRDISILGAGNLIPLKQFNIFIEVIAGLRKTFPDIKAKICGKGPEEKQLQSLITNYDLINNIELIGEIPHYELLMLMQRTNILLHPSSYEGFGVVCLEALCAGAQVISFVQPMNDPIRNWHIADDKVKMEALAKQILMSESVPEKIVPFAINDTVRKIRELFLL